VRGAADLIRDIEGGVEVAVWVVPGVSRPGLAGLHDGALRVRVAAPPERARANREAARRVAEALGGRGGRVVAGETARRKRIAVEGVDAAVAIERLEAAGILP
jgi:uncharacterized protein YggU (UPF0235/DUF167 family)